MAVREPREAHCRVFRPDRDRPRPWRSGDEGIACTPFRKWRRYAAYLWAGSGLVESFASPSCGPPGFSRCSSLALPFVRAQWFAGLVALALLGFVAVLKFSSTMATRVTAFLEIGVETGRKTVEEVKDELAAD